MKKNNKHWYKESLRKYKVGFLIFNILLITFVFLIFTIFLTVVVEERFFNDVQTQIKRIDKDIDKNSFNKYVQSLEIEDPRITVVLYYSDPKESSFDQLLSPEILGYIKIGNLDDLYVTDIGKISEEDAEKYDKVEIGNHNYMTFVTKKWYKTVDKETEKDIVVSYVKIYMNIDGEVASKEELNVGLIMCTLLLLVLGALTGYLIMKKSIKPLEVFVEKQVSFVSDASHELRTPIAIVQSKIENILANPEQSIYDVSEDLAISLTELARLNKLTADLLALARSDQDRVVYNLEKVNLNILLSEIIDPFIEIAEFENRFLRYEAEDVDVTVDKDKIRELMIIILDNALKYTNEGDEIIISLRNGMFDAIIEVADTGIGITEETKEKIFERFYREDKARSRQTGGNGLGLSIAKTIVTDMKGKISVDHNSPKGTKFTITFPKTK